MRRRVFGFFSRLLVAIAVVSCMSCVSFARTADDVDNKQQIVVDRVEGKYAVCQTEDGEMIDVRVSKFQTKPKEGDIFQKGNKGKYVKNKAATKKAKLRIASRMERLFK
ncbi:MAG: DUF3006 domain-containing protein [Clostridia bacterium]|nr:DUF3006 domain-containing protein [Clostridia bacterium]